MWGRDRDGVHQRLYCSGGSGISKTSTQTGRATCGMASVYPSFYKARFWSAYILGTMCNTAEKIGLDGYETNMVKTAFTEIVTKKIKCRVKQCCNTSSGLYERAGCSGWPCKMQEQFQVPSWRRKQSRYAGVIKKLEFRIWLVWTILDEFRWLVFKNSRALWNENNDKSGELFVGFHKCFSTRTLYFHNPLLLWHGYTVHFVLLTCSEKFWWCLIEKGQTVVGCLWVKRKKHLLMLLL